MGCDRISFGSKKEEMNKYSEKQRYYPSYTLDQKGSYEAAFQRDGFVVIDHVLTADQCKASIDEIWAYLENQGTIDRNDRNSWDNEHWPKEICRNGGFIGRFPYWKRMKTLDGTCLNSQPQAWRNRENPNVYAAFQSILKQEKLWVSLDRYGIMRPTKSAGNSMEEWKSKSDWLHWDLSPFHFGTSAAGFAPKPDLDSSKIQQEYGPLRVQGLITLADCPEESGGFHCVPAFVNEVFFEWAERNKESYGSASDIKTRNFIEVPLDDPMRESVVRVPMRAGSLLIWNSQLPHGNFPNNGSEFRMVQYIKMIEAENNLEFIPAMSFGRLKKMTWFPDDYSPSALGKKLLGLDAWPDCT